MTRNGFKANEASNLQTPSFKYPFGKSNNYRKGQLAHLTSIVSNAKMTSMWICVWSMHLMRIKVVGCVTDVIELLSWRTSAAVSYNNALSFGLYSNGSLVFQFNRESDYKLIRG